MKYFSLFSGIGGFELGIEQALQNNVCLQGSKYKTESSRCKTNSWVEPKQPERLGYYDNMQTKGLQQREHNQNMSHPQRPQLPPKPFCVGFSEIDKYATQIYKKHFPNHKEYGDISKISWSDVPKFDLLVGGVPCQAWSIAGKRKGFDDSRGTMWYEFFRCLKEKQPSMFIAENVKGILSHNKGNSFEEICVCFCELGYVIDFEILNSKNFGVPQNRERVFIVGIKINLLDKCQVF